MVDYNIILIGFMGTGKSTIARALSEKLNIESLDTDQIIETKMKMTISEIFEKYGQAKFRQIEKDVVREVSLQKNKVISCGGGVCVMEENIKNIKYKNKVVLLEARPDVIFNRVKKDTSRPLLKNQMDLNRIKKLLDERKSSYHKAADIIIDTSNKSISEVVDEILINILGDDKYEFYKNKA